MGVEAHDHDWAHTRMAAFAAGLLDESTAARFEKHVADCANCREELDALRDPGASLSEHLPDGLVARWNEKKPELRGLQRELIRRHLTSCDECRTILQHLGHEPVLDRVAGLEAALELLARLEAGGVASEEPVPRSVIKLPPIWRRRDFWLGGAFSGAVAAAAAVVFVVNPALHAQKPATSSAPSSPVQGSQGTSGNRHLATSGTQGSFALDPLGGAVHLETVRGSAVEKVIKVTSATRTIRLSAEPPDVPDTARVRVTLIDPRATLAMDEVHPVADFYPTAGFLVHSPRGFDAGRYVLRIEGRGDLASRYVEYEILIRVTAANQE